MNDFRSRLAESLQRLGYRAKLSDEFVDSIESASDGLTFFLWLSRASWLQFSIFVSNNDKPIDLDLVNKFNEKFRVYKVVSSDGYLMTADFYYPPLFKDEIPDEVLNEWMSVWSLGLGLMKSELFSIGEAPSHDNTSSSGNDA